MKTIKLTEKQINVVTELALKKQQLEQHLSEVSTNLNNAISLIAEFNDVDKYEKVEINNNELLFH